MKTISLTAVQESENQPKKIVCYDLDGGLFAEVFIDRIITFYSKDVQLQDVKQITFVAENFELFFNNLTQK